MKRTRLNRNAFTLIEILVVVAIIALLIAVLLPSLARARGQARSAVCLANLHRLAHAGFFYTETFRCFPPFRLKKVYDSAKGSWVDYFNRYGRKAPRWQWFFDYGVGPVINAKGVLAGSDEMTSDYFLCPSLSGPHERNIRNGGYGYNYQYLGNSREMAVPGRYENWPVAVGRIRSSARTVLIADGRGADSPHGPHSYTLDPPRLATEAGATKFGPELADVAAGKSADLAYSPVEARHNDRGAVVFVDGHAELMQVRQLGYSVGADSIARPAAYPVAKNSLWSGIGDAGPSTVKP